MKLNHNIILTTDIVPDYLAAKYLRPKHFTQDNTTVEVIFKFKHLYYFCTVMYFIFNIASLGTRTRG